MKISKLFHWLYATVMFLPLFVAPIFAIYTRNESATYAQTIEVEQNEVVDFNQKLNALRTQFYTRVNSYTIDISNSLTGYLFLTDTIDVEPTHTYFYHIKSSTQGYRTTAQYLLPYLNSAALYQGFYANLTGSDAAVVNVVFDTSNSTDGISTINFNLIDLTQMFGAGNEPTSNDFYNSYNSFYDYTVSHKELLKNVSTVTYSNTDIGSQFLYTMYITTDKYLNFDEVLNLGAISDWINLNVFNGNAPLVYYIVWHYLDYWLVLSIFWLCFDVLIYVPQLAHRWLDKASLE